jgi:hypothetical protein
MCSTGGKYNDKGKKQDVYDSRRWKKHKYHENRLSFHCRYCIASALGVTTRVYNHYDGQGIRFEGFLELSLRITKDYSLALRNEGYIAYAIVFIKAIELHYIITYDLT